MKLIVERHYKYGADRIFVRGPEGELLSRLLGKKTISWDDLECLYILGFDILTDDEMTKHFINQLL